jgi:hypothetical protein
VDVAHGHDERLDVGLPQEVGGDALDVAPGAVGPAHPPLGLGGLAAPLARRGREQRRDHRVVGEVGVVVERRAKDVVPVVPEQIAAPVRLRTVPSRSATTAFFGAADGGA